MTKTESQTVEGLLDEGVSLVYDEGSEFRQDMVVNQHVRQQQGMVGHNQIGLGHGFDHPQPEAFIMVLAFLPQTAVAVSHHHRPVAHKFRAEAQFLAVTATRSFSPDHHLLEELDLIFFKGFAARQYSLVLVPAQVILPAFGFDILEIKIQGLCQLGQVAVYDLLLECFGLGRDHYLFPVLQCP